MLGSVNPTEFDLRFPLFGIPVRVHPVFWLCAAFLTWRGDRVDLTLVGVIAVFLSILTHEFGHAFFARKYGFSTEIVLYFFGGYATVGRWSTKKNVITLLAGPCAGLVLYGVTQGTLWLGREYGWFENWSNVWQQRASFFFTIMLFANLAWSLMNLLPVLPLDGGQICRELSAHFRRRDGEILAVKIGIGVSAAVALYGAYCIRQGLSVFGAEPKFLTFLFVILCFQNVQILQASNRRW